MAEPVLHWRGRYKGGAACPARGKPQFADHPLQITCTDLRCTAERRYYESLRVLADTHAGSGQPSRFTGLGNAGGASAEEQSAAEAGWAIVNGMIHIHSKQLGAFEAPADKAWLLQLAINGVTRALADAYATHNARCRIAAYDEKKG